MSRTGALAPPRAYTKNMATLAMSKLTILHKTNVGTFSCLREKCVKLSFFVYKYLFYRC